MKPGLCYRLHMWFIRLITRQVELVQTQLEINKLLKQIQQTTEQMCVPRVFVDKSKRRKK
jgi:hypothetical protein